MAAAAAGGAGDRARVSVDDPRARPRPRAARRRSTACGCPRHEPGPPETLTDTDYANLLRVPDRRTIAGKRDYALLRVLGDCGLRSAELRGLRARDLRRPRANARHHRLYVRGKGGREREVPVPEAVQQALEAWIGGPSARPRRRRCSTSSRCSCASAATATRSLSPSPPSPCTGSCAAHCLAAGVPERLAHPHALRAYWATHLLEAGVPVHEVSARLGHVDLRTTARYAAPRPERVDEIAEVLDRRHQAARRAGWGA